MNKLEELSHKKKEIQRQLGRLHEQIRTVDTEIEVEKNKGPKWAKPEEIACSLSDRINIYKTSCSDILNICDNSESVGLYLEDVVNLLKFLQEQIILPEEQKEYTTKCGDYDLGENVVDFYDDNSVYLNRHSLTQEEAIKLRDLLVGFDFGNSDA